MARNVLFVIPGMGILRVGFTIIVAVCAVSFMTGIADASLRPSSLFVTMGMKGEPLSGDECLKRCVGCPFHDHRFYNFSTHQPTTETDIKGIFPVIYGGEVISKMGDARDGRKHMGIDIAARAGAPIVAAWTGKVFYSGWNSLGGWVVILKHTNGYVTYYAHMKDRPTVQPGQLVIAGQRLGALGKTGNAQATIPHLHFEVSKNSGKAINPLNVL